jgi:hypothetical protein
MTSLSRNAQVLRYLLEVAPGVGHTKLAKFAYLADLEARKYLGGPVSEFRYVRDQHGPFDAKRFFAARDGSYGAGTSPRSKSSADHTWVTRCFRPLRCPNTTSPSRRPRS